MDLSTPSSSASEEPEQAPPDPSTASRKRLKLSPAALPRSKWRTPAQERLYRRRLLDALRGQPSPRDPRAVKDAADSALALSASGRTRWSRAILSRRWRVRKTALLAAGKIRRKRPPRASQPPRQPEGKVGQRLRRLARLVPGCRRAPAGSLLEETADYVAALEVQVRAMRALAEALAAAALSSGEQEEDRS